jgi:hypothetical protein
MSTSIFATALPPITSIAVAIHGFLAMDAC